VQLISSREEVVQTPALRTIGNIVTGNDEQTDRVIRAGALPLLRQMLFHHKKSLRKEACWSLSNVTAGTPAQVAAVIACDIIPPVVNLLHVSVSPRHRTPQNSPNITPKSSSQTLRRAWLK
jgi:importin subunit alpha-6/7